MFGTVARITVKPGKEQDLLVIGERWTHERGEASGQVAQYVFKLERVPNEYIIVGIFPDRDAYYRNAADPATHRWYQQIRELLEGDPEWNDGEVVQSALFSSVV